MKTLFLRAVVEMRYSVPVNSAAQKEVRNLLDMPEVEMLERLNSEMGEDDMRWVKVLELRPEE